MRWGDLVFANCLTLLSIVYKIDSIERGRAMSIVAKIASYLGVSESRVTAQEWAKVYWVHVQGRRPTLLSKKLVDRAAQIRIGYTGSGQPLAKDEVTGQAYILCKPGMETLGEWAIAEIANPSLSSEFWQGKNRVAARFTQKPATVRELIVFKAVNNAWRAA